uniref:Putative transcription factor TFIIB zinc-binding motif n=2 Tax=viral metagenome TaxID=1070528 RepID=A0A6M3M6A2_9ZZZZ
MKLKIMRVNKDYVRYAECPVCGLHNTVIIKEDAQLGQFTCWNCGSLIAWSVEDEGKEGQDENTG